MNWWPQNTSSVFPNTHVGTAISVGDGASAEALSKAGREAEKEAYVTFSLFRTSRLKSPIFEDSVVFFNCFVVVEIRT